MRKYKDDGLEGTDAEFFSAQKPKKLQKKEQERTRESKLSLVSKLMKPPTAFEAEFQSDAESDAEFRTWGGEDTISGVEGWLASDDCCEGVFWVCAGARQ